MRRCTIAIAFLATTGLYIAALFYDGFSDFAVSDNEAAALYGGTCPLGYSTNCGEQGQPPNNPCNGKACCLPKTTGEVEITGKSDVSCGGSSCGFNGFVANEGCS